jgi:SAM-dependent methyltransferase
VEVFVEERITTVAPEGGARRRRAPSTLWSWAAVKTWLVVTLPFAFVFAGDVFPAPDRPVASIISPQYADEATRDRHREAQRVIDRLGIKPGTRVADIGAGTGYYTVRLARRLGPGATIYAEDITPEYLKELEARLAREKISGVRIVRGEPRDPKLPPDSVDVAILAYVYHEIENPFEFLYRLRPVLARGARIGIVDLDRPTQDHGTPPELLRCELAAVGYRQVDFMLLAPADGYLAVFVPPTQLPPIAAIKPCRQP